MRELLDAGQRYRPTGLWFSQRQVRMLNMRLHVAVAIAVVTSVLLPAAAFALPGVSGWATLSDNRTYLNAYGTRGDVYAYARPAYGMKVNSIYVKAPGDPDNYGVEAGYTSTGVGDTLLLPINHNAWFFTSRMKAGVWLSDDFGYAYGLPVGSRTRVSISNTGGGHDWNIYYGTTLLRTWTDTGFLYGRLQVGEERNYSSTDPRAAITNMEYVAKTGSAYGWYDWNYGVGDGYDSGYSFKFNHVADANHWV